MKTLTLPCYNIVIELGEEDPEHPGYYFGGNLVTSDLKKHCILGDSLDAEEMDEEDVAGVTAGDALESMILAHAVAGIDVASPAYVEGIETAVEAIANNL